ncbi:hypothetical protein CEE45_02085 [Candidatus Heimdallarchaeota archaeon B3_Heim]|nr:MAG: hypothetical protein CEE45_02085 [Candidatus Heimdallarchaeota archaeon B3_Heim]
MFNNKWEILIVSSIFILAYVILKFTEYWFGMIMMILVLINGLWTEFETRKLAGKDPMTQSANKMVIMLGGLLIGIGLIFLIMSIINRIITPKTEIITPVLLLGGLTLVGHEFFKRYRAVSYKTYQNGMQ